MKTDPEFDIAIVDLDMPIMNGYEISEILRDKHPDINVLILTMIDDEQSIIRMVKSGVKGYLGKDINPSELKKAIESVNNGVFHFNQAFSEKLLQMALNEGGNGHGLNDRELKFLELCCSELTYKEIADQMCLSPKTIDGYRANLFERFEIKSRVRLVMLAIKSGWVDV